MKDERLIALKIRAEKDRALSDSAARLFALIISDRYTHPRWLIGDDFALAWSWVHLNTGLSERQAYRKLKELCERGYLIYQGRKGCPGKNHFIIPVPDRKAERTATTSKAASRRSEYLPDTDANAPKLPIGDVIKGMREAANAA